MWVHCAWKLIKYCGSLISQKLVWEREGSERERRVWIISTWRTHCQPQNGLQLPSHERTGRAEASANPQKTVTWECAIKTEDDQTTSCYPIYLSTKFHYTLVKSSGKKWIENISNVMKAYRKTKQNKKNTETSPGKRHWSRCLLGRCVKIWRCITCVRNKGPQGCEYVAGVGIALMLHVCFHVLLPFAVIACKSAVMTTSTS